MICHKCGGLVIETYAVSLDGTALESRCVNCGRRAGDSSIEAVHPPTRHDYGLRLLPPAKPDDQGDDMPKFVDEAHRQRWIEGQRKAREEKKKSASAAEKTEKPKRKPKPKPAKKATPAQVATVEKQEAGTWDDWKASIIAQLEDAERKLRERLDAVMAAQGTIRAL